MKSSLSVWSMHKYMYSGEMDNEQFIEFTATTGAKGVELLSVFWKEDGREEERIHAALQRTGLQMACFGASNNLALADPDARRTQLLNITSSVDRAVLFGAQVVRVFSGDKEQDVTYEDAKTWTIAGLKEAASYAEDKGIKLCLENHGLFAGKADQVLEVIREVHSDHLCSTFDTGNFLLVDENPSEAITKLKDYVAHVHIKDFAIVKDGYSGTIYTSLEGKKFTGHIPGEGSVDLPYILRELKNNNYTGWLTLEYEGDEEQKEGSTRSIHNLEAYLAAL